MAMVGSVYTAYEVFLSLMEWNFFVELVEDWAVKPPGWGSKPYVPNLNEPDFSSIIAFHEQGSSTSRLKAFFVNIANLVKTKCLTVPSSIDSSLYLPWHIQVYVGIVIYEVCRQCEAADKWNY